MSRVEVGEELAETRADLQDTGAIGGLIRVLLHHDSTQLFLTYLRVELLIRPEMAL